MGGGFGGGHMGGFGGGHIGGLGGGHMGDLGGGRIAGLGGGTVGRFDAGHLAHAGGRRRFVGGGYYDDGLDCPYNPYYTSQTWPYSCTY
jgi:hypothetical protein